MVRYIWNFTEKFITIKTFKLKTWKFTAFHSTKNGAAYRTQWVLITLQPATRQIDFFSFLKSPAAIATTSARNERQFYFLFNPQHVVATRYFVFIYCFSGPQTDFGFEICSNKFIVASLLAWMLSCLDKRAHEILPL